MVKKFKRLLKKIKWFVLDNAIQMYSLIANLFINKNKRIHIINY